MKGLRFLLLGLAICLTKSGIIGALFLGSIGLKAANPGNNFLSTNNNTIPTEFVSKESAEGAKVLALTQINQPVPTINNRKLDNTYRKFIENAEDREYVEDYISKIYKNNGSFLGSALIQHEINVNQFLAFMSGNTKMIINNNINPELGRKVESRGPDFYKSITPQKEIVENFVLNNYSQQLVKLFAFDHKPTAKEVLAKIQSIIKNQPDVSNNEFMQYIIDLDNFNRISLKEKKDDQSMMDLVAYGMFMLDKIAFEHIIMNYGVSGKQSYYDGEYNTADYYRMWMDSVEPKGQY